MSLYKQFQTNNDAEVDGAWFSFPQPDGSIIELLLARTGGSNSGYKRALRKLLRKHSRATDVPIDQYAPARDEICEAMAEHVLKGWRTRLMDDSLLDAIADEQGTMIAYSQQRATKLLKDLPELRSDITVKSADFHNFQDTDAESIEGNSSPPSSGGSVSAKSTPKPKSAKSTS